MTEIEKQNQTTALDILTKEHAGKNKTYSMQMRQTQNISSGKYLFFFYKWTQKELYYITVSFKSMEDKYFSNL